MRSLPLIAVLMLMSLTGCRTSSTTFQRPEMDISEPLDDFCLTERNGTKVCKNDLTGKVWIASFVFTRCTSHCPSVMGTLARLQDELDLANQPDLRFVTFTVDPERDQPAELINYAKSYRAHDTNWLFLTGDEKEIHRLSRESLKLHVGRNENPKPGDEFGHSTKLVLIDKQGNVRGYFQGMADPQMPESLDADLARLKKKVGELLR